MRDPALEWALRIRGATTRLARGLGITTAAVSQWQRVPEERLGQAALILGVPPAKLRPDLFRVPRRGRVVTKRPAAEEVHGGGVG